MPEMIFDPAPRRLFTGLRAACLLLAAWLAACATIPDDFRQPTVALVSIEPRVLNSMTPEFDILLRVGNPNRKALKIAGLTYEVLLAGNKVVEGLASDLPRIEAYGEADVTLRARADLLGGINLLAGLMDRPNEPVPYQFRAEIDIGPFYPTIKVDRGGQLHLN